MGAGLPVRWRSQHELPGPGTTTDHLLLHACKTSRTTWTGTTRSTADLPRRRCRTTPSSSAMTACTTGTSCSRLRTTACTASPASPVVNPTDRQAYRDRTARSACEPDTRIAPGQQLHHLLWPIRDGTPMLPAGKYVVEVVVPPGYELVKEEDKNILIGDNYIAPVTQQFAGLGNIFIMPDQAEVAASYNPNNAAEFDERSGTGVNLPRHEGDTGSVETFWPCVGAARIVPDFISLFPRIGRKRAVRRSDSQPLRSQGSHADGSDVGAGEVLRLHLDPRRRPTSRASSPTTSRRNSIRSRRSSARNSPRPTCRCRSRTGPETKSLASIPMSSASTTA